MKGYLVCKSLPNLRLSFSKIGAVINDSIQYCNSPFQGLRQHTLLLLSLQIILEPWQLEQVRIDISLLLYSTELRYKVGPTVCPKVTVFCNHPLNF